MMITKATTTAATISLFPSVEVGASASALPDTVCVCGGGGGGGERGNKVIVKGKKGSRLNKTLPQDGILVM